MSDLKQINARIPVELHDQLAAHKERTGEEKSEVLRRGIEMALGVEVTPPPHDVDALVAALAEMRRQDRLNVKDLVAKLNRELELGKPAASPPSAAPEPAAPEAEPEPAADPTSDSSSSNEEPKEEHGSIDFPAWVAERTDMPRALARLKIVAGHVSIDGVRYQEETVSAQLLETAAVTLNGQLL